MNEWYIKLFRSLLEWEWYDDINTKVLFIHLLLKANYKDKKWRWIEIKKWENLTSYPLLSKETGLSEMQIRTCLKKLKTTGEITHITTNNYSIIKLNNYDKYNWDNIQVNTLITDKQQTNNTQVTPKEERKNIKKEENIKSKDLIFTKDSFFYKTAKDFLDFHLDIQTPSVIYQLNNKWEENILQQWADEVRKLHDLDNFNEKQIEFIFNFTKKNDFWSKQILSISKFRKKNDDWVPYFVVMINEAKKSVPNKKSNWITFW